MTAESTGARRRSGVNWRRAELVLTGLGILGFVTFRTGDLGAKAVWQGRIHAAHAGALRPPA
jgi:hypothetical protein